jgi:hypothetical protein
MTSLLTVQIFSFLLSFLISLSTCDYFIAKDIPSTYPAYLPTSYCALATLRHVLPKRPTYQQGLSLWQGTITSNA